MLHEKLHGFRKWGINRTLEYATTIKSSPGYLLVFSESVVGVVVTDGAFSRVMQQLHMRPPLQRSNGLPPSMMQEMLRLQSNTLPLYQQVCGITETENTN